jgi:hypothetical protein
MTRPGRRWPSTTARAPSARTWTVGCSDEQYEEVSGTVTVDGSAPEKGSISFDPVDGNSITAGAPIENGKYFATKVPLGTMRVQIRVPVVYGMKELYKNEKGESQYRPTFKKVLPQKYNEDTGLKFDVKPGSNEKNWELSTK